MAHSVNISKSTLFRLVKSGALKRHSNALKHFLKEEHKRARLKFCLSMLNESTIPDDPTFQGLHNIVYIEEKWFYLKKRSKTYYLLPNEEEPSRTCVNKNYIEKVMFLVALARPRFDAQGNETFSGKIGVFPFVTKVPVRRNSVNRVVGTLETKPITSITRDIMRSYILEKVLPAIKMKWPREDINFPIFIQQDNARVHIRSDDQQFRQIATADGFDIRLMCQPANSPYLNVLDLGFFKGIQSLQEKMCSRTVNELVTAVETSFEAFPNVKSNHIFLTLQNTMIEIMKVKGCNKYQPPHMKKAVLEHRGQLPIQMKCDHELVQEVIHYLSEM